jgi:hypothetical protein
VNIFRASNTYINPSSLFSLVVATSNPWCAVDILVKKKFEEDIETYYSSQGAQNIRVEIKLSVPSINMRSPYTCVRVWKYELYEFANSSTSALQIRMNALNPIYKPDEFANLHQFAKLNLQTKQFANLKPPNLKYQEKFKDQKIKIQKLWHTLTADGPRNHFIYLFIFIFEFSGTCQICSRVYHIMFFFLLL